MQPLTLKNLRDFLMEEGRGEALCLAPDPVWDEGEEHYFCTPVGAKIIGSAGVDGIHFCQIPGAARVYAVSPMNGEGERVHPVAENLGDFCRLLLACGSTAAIEQAWQWDKAAFVRFVGEDQPDAEGRAALEALAERFSLGRMEDPYDYMAKVREGFSESDLIYPAEEGTEPAQLEEPDHFPSFYGDTVRFPPVGRPIPFQWGGEEAYVLGYGVVDGWFIVDVAFHWTNEMIDQLLKAQSWDGFEVSIDTRLAAGSPNSFRGCSVTYFPEYVKRDAEWRRMASAGRMIWHYSLRASQNWVIHRQGFRWEEGFGGPAVLTVAHEEYWKEAARFTVTAAGQVFTLPHPDGGELTLRVTAFEPEDIGEQLPGERDGEPHKLRSMGYTLSPDPGKERVRLQDTAPSDPYRGADGPTAAFIGVIGPDIAASSSLRFEVPESVTWSYQFQYQDPEKVEILLPTE